MCDMHLITISRKFGRKCAKIAPNILRRLVRDPERSLDKHWEGCYCQAEPPLLFIFLKTINNQHGKC